jgi:ketosteroid isomerase-like protein
MTRDEAWKLAEHWIVAWNAHDLDSIMAHYEDVIELTSPVAAQLLGTSDGKVVGKANVRAYFQRGLKAYPELHFRLEDVLWGVNSVVLYYTNHEGTRTEFHFRECESRDGTFYLKCRIGETNSTLSPARVCNSF